MVELQTAKLKAFDHQCPEAPSDAERTRLKSLGGCLSAVWNDAQSDSGIKKQIVRLLIDHTSSERQRQGWLTQQQAATNLGISPMSINRLIEAQILPAEGELSFPRVIHAEELSKEVVQAAVSRIKSHANAPLPTNPNQRTLDF